MSEAGFVCLQEGIVMAYMSMNVNECRVFVKNGKLRLQAALLDTNGDIMDQVTLCMSPLMADQFAKIEDLDNDSVQENSGGRLGKFFFDDK